MQELEELVEVPVVHAYGELQSKAEWILHESARLDGERQLLLVVQKNPRMDCICDVTTTVGYVTSRVSCIHFA